MGDLLNKSPDVLVVSPGNLRYSEEIEYLKAAKRLHIPTAAAVLSWDNLSTKGLFHIRPDRLFVWNKYQYQDAIEIHRFSPHRLRVAGSSFFDKWFSHSTLPLTREQFCTHVGFDPTKPILLYLGSSRNIAKDESWFVRDLLAGLQQQSLLAPKKVQLLLRPHPANVDIYESLRAEQSGARVWPEAGALPETPQAFADMRNSFEHADAVIGINTSGMIDAVLADLPTFSIRLPAYRQTQADSLHFQYLERAGVLYISDSLATFFEEFGAVLHGRDPQAGNRRKFAELFARPRGLERAAGDVIAEEIISMALPRRKVAL
jgi:hypothetical protein